MSTLSASDWPVQPPDWPGFRMFPRDPGNSKARNRVRVPPRAQQTPSSEGAFALTGVHSGWSGPSDTGRGVCLAPRVTCELVGERVQGRGWLALRWLCTGVIRSLLGASGRSWLAYTSLWVGRVSAT